MKLTHTGDNRLASLLISGNIKGGVFLGESIQGNSKLVLILPRLRFNGYANYRRRKLHLLENDGLVLVTNGCPGSDLLHTADGNYLAGARVFDVFALIRVHAHQPAHALSCILDGIVSGGYGFNSAAINAH